MKHISANTKVAQKGLQHSFFISGNLLYNYLSIHIG
jgi:hypothetical protein